MAASRGQRGHKQTTIPQKTKLNEKDFRAFITRVWRMHDASLHRYMNVNLMSR